MAMDKFEVGDTFTSQSSLFKVKSAFEQKNFVQLYVSDSRIIKAASRRASRTTDPLFKVYTVKFCCIHWGRKYKATGKIERKSSYVYLLSEKKISAWKTWHLQVTFYYYNTMEYFCSNFLQLVENMCSNSNLLIQYQTLLHKYHTLQMSGFS